MYHLVISINSIFVFLREKRIWKIFLLTSNEEVVNMRWYNYHLNHNFTFVSKLSYTLILKVFNYYHHYYTILFFCCCCWCCCFCCYYFVAVSHYPSLYMGMYCLGIFLCLFPYEILMRRAYIPMKVIYVLQGISTGLSVAALWIWSRGVPLHSRARMAVNAMLGMVAVQVIF